MAKTISGLDKALQSSLDLSAYSKTSHTHSYLPLSGGTMTGVITTPNSARGIKVGDDVYLCDRDVSNSLVLEGGQDATTASIIFGSGKDTNLYRGGANILKTDDTFNAVSGFQWNGQSLDNRYAASSHGTHVSYSTTAPKVAGTAAVGSESSVARGDHVHAAQTTVSGNAGSATKLATARTLTIGGTGKTFDGSGNVSWSLSEIGAFPAAGGSFKGNITGETRFVGENLTYSDPWTNTSCTIKVTGKVAATDTIKAPTFSGSLSGNADTATKLATARNIVIGNKTNSFNGTANITFTLADIGAAATSHTHNDILGEDLSGKTMSLNDLNLSSGTPKYKVCFCPTDGNGSNITGRPNDSSKQAFNLIVESLRHASTTDYITKQTYTQGSTKQIHVRYCTSGTWSAWEKVYTSGQKPSASDIGAAASSHGTHVTYATATPKANGTAAVGTSSKVAREDHIHPTQTSVAQLTTARTLTIGNTGKSFNGTANVSWSLSEIGALPCASVTSGDLNNFKTTGYYSVQNSALTNTPTSGHAMLFVDATVGTPFQLFMHDGTFKFYKRNWDSTTSAWNNWSDTLANNISGNAATATKLATARTLTIGSTGKSFDGSANVSWSLSEIGAAASSHTHNYAGSGSAGGAANSATKLATARTLTIGNTGKTFDGSGNVSWSLSEIGALPTTGGTLVGNLSFSEVTSTTYPANSNRLIWHGSTDRAEIYYRVEEADKGTLIFNLKDDTNASIGFAYNDTIKSRIDASGNFSGNAETASKANKTLVKRITGNTESANYDPGANTSTVREYDAICTETPSYHWYHIYTSQGLDSKYTTQLAVGMTTEALCFRNKNNGAWGSWKKASVDGHTHSYLPLAGGTVTGAIKRSQFQGTWVGAMKDSLITSTYGTAGGFQPMFAGKTTNGYMATAYYQDTLQVAYITKANVDAGTNTTAKTVTLANESGGGVWSGTVSAPTFSENGTTLANKYAAKSHGTHLTIGTGASNAAAGNHTHSTYATTTTTGSLSSLQTTAKGSLVAAINEVFQSGNNVKQQLVDALIAKGVEDASTSMSFSELIEYIGLFKQYVNIKADIGNLLVGDTYVFLIKLDGTLWVAGYSYYGSLGTGGDKAVSFTKVNITDIKQIVTSMNHTVILKTDGTVWACGNNESGQLGRGNTTNSKTFVKANITDVVSIACGWAHTVAIKSDGTVWACGNNSNGQLGRGNTTGSSSFVQITTNVNNVANIYCGGNVTYLLKTDGSLFATGSNLYGEAGVNAMGSPNAFTQCNVSGVKHVTCGHYHVLVQKTDGTVWGCGYNYTGQLGLGNNTDKYGFTQVNITDVKTLVAGSYCSYIVKNDGTLWVCGTNSHGQLGLGNTTNKNTFTKCTLPSNVGTIANLYAGGNQCVIVNSDGKVFGAGYNGYDSALGLGSNGTNYSTFTPINDLTQ